MPKEAKRIISQTSIAGNFELLVLCKLPELKDRGYSNTEVGYLMYMWQTQVATRYMSDKRFVYHGLHQQNCP
jgi:hypothetical protein